MQHISAGRMSKANRKSMYIVAVPPYDAPLQFLPARTQEKHPKTAGRIGGLRGQNRNRISSRSPTRCVKKYRSCSAYILFEHRQP